MDYPLQREKRERGAMGAEAGATRLDFEILGTPSELDALERACETYARGWCWGFERRTLGIADTDWLAFRALQPEGYDETLYRGTRHGFQAAWCVAQGADRPKPQNVARCNGRGVRHSAGEVLAFDATFATRPPIPDDFRVTSLRIGRTATGWCGSVSGRVR